MARNLSRVFRGLQRLGSGSAGPVQTLGPRSASAPSAVDRVSFTGTMGAQSSWLYSTVAPRDYSLPNASWGPEILQVYQHYTSLCEGETEGGLKQEGSWRRIPGYDRLHKISELGNLIPESKARVFTRSVTEEGAAFEYALFLNKEEKKVAGVFQTGHLVEGPPGVVHGGAIVSMIDTVIASHAICLCGPSMTLNLSIDYLSALHLGSTVLIESVLEKTEGRKLHISCRVSSPDRSVVYAECKVLFVIIRLSQLPK